MKKLLSICLALILMIGFASTAFAAELSIGSAGFAETIIIETGELTDDSWSIVYDDAHETIGENPEFGLITPFGTSQPRNVWNLRTRGRYNFRGVANVSRLYTNYLLTDASQVRIRVNNNHPSATLVVRLVHVNSFLFFNSTVSTVRVPPNGFTQWTVNGLTASANHWITFDAPSNFNGWIERVS